MNAFLISFVGLMDEVPVKIFALEEEAKAEKYHQRLLKYYAKLDKSILIEPGEHHPDVLSALFAANKNINSYTDIILYEFENSKPIS